MIEQSRRSVMLGAVGLASLGISSGGTATLLAEEMPGEPDPVIPLWPGTPPGGSDVRLEQHVEDHTGGGGLRARRLSRIGSPALVVKRAAEPNGAAMMVIPGGGYSVLNYDTGGTDHARWLNAAGVTVFILVYRLPGEGWARRAEVPLQDAQRAIRLIRAQAGTWGIDPQRVGVLGSSAGGHLAGSLATRFADAVYDPVDASDALPALAGPRSTAVSGRDHGRKRPRALAQRTARARFFGGDAGCLFPRTACSRAGSADLPVLRG